MPIFFSIGLEKEEAHVANQKVHVAILIVVDGGAKFCAHNALPEMAKFGVKIALNSKSGILLYCRFLLIL